MTAFTHLTHPLTVLLWLLLAVPCAAAPAYRPQPFTAHYAVHYNGFKVGEIERRLEVQAEGRYMLETTMYTTGLVALFKEDRATERSTWIYRDDVMQPLEYHAEYSGRAKDAKEHVDFDWDQGVATADRRGVVARLPLTAGVLDKLSHQIVLRADIMRGLRQMEYPVIDRNEIMPYHYEVEGEENVVTARGTLRAIRVRKGTTTFWVAKDLDYLLIKLVQENEDGTFASYIQAP